MRIEIEHRMLRELAVAVHQRRRVMQVADIYDALTTARPYKPAFSHDRAVAIMLEESRRGWRDPELVPLFAEVIARQDDVEPGGVSMQQSLEAMRRELAE